MSPKAKFGVACIADSASRRHIYPKNVLGSLNILGTGKAPVTSESSNSRHCYRYNSELLEGGGASNYIGMIR